MFLLNLIKKSHKSPESSPKKSKVHQTNDNGTPISDNFYVTKRIGQSRFPVFQVVSRANGHTYAMKLFPHTENGPQEYYKNEIRFAVLKHPYIVPILHKGDTQDISYQGEPSMFSYTLMDFAPYGDFFDLIKNFGQYFDEKIIRTYFRQLIEGLEFLHDNRVAHLDLKPENLLLGADLKLKIADFDTSYVQGDVKFISKGTRSYRGPEFYESNLENVQLELPFAADVYSAGIILFIMKSRVYPYIEDETPEDVDLLNLMNKNNGEFWRKHCDIQEKPALFYSKDFRDLFNGMVKANPRQRLTIKQIKKSNWYNGPIYSNSKLQKKMNEILNTQLSR